MDDRPITIDENELTSFIMRTTKLEREIIQNVLSAEFLFLMIKGVIENGGDHVVYNTTQVQR